MRAGHPIEIITISREFGSGGSQIAHLLGRRLGWRVIDHELIEEVAHRLNASADEVERLDEQIGGLVERVGVILARGIPDAPIMPVSPDADYVAQIERAVIRDAASAPPFIVVGHGTQCIFHDRADALHVRVVAPLAMRARRVAERSGRPLAEAENQTRRTDAQRRRYIRHHFGCEPADPDLYDLQINTGSIGLDEAADLIHRVVMRHGAAGAAAPPSSLPST
ncbi:MAG TPA: cytidylate kinase-like family protein [Longimicrobiales bacterium]|nr:cytidylate kinase-like family protein [Longimicrobiales bacterium]